MKTLVIGAGALGSVFGGGLAYMGNEVTLLGRGTHIKTVQEKGLNIKGLKEYTVELKATTQPAELDSFDLLVLAVKMQDSSAVLDAVSHIKVGAVLSFQNGVTKDDELAKHFGKAKVLGATSIIGASRLSPGEANWTFDGGTYLGEFDRKTSSRAQNIIAQLQAAGFKTELSDDILAATWSKFVGWVPLGLLGLLTHLTSSELLAEESVSEMYVLMVRELSELAARRDIKVTDFGPYLLETLSTGTVDEALCRVSESPLAFRPDVGRGPMHSMAQDILSGKTTELESCIGPIIKESNVNGIDIPVTKMIYNLARCVESSLDIPSQ